jgi:hypothetical protein
VSSRATAARHRITVITSTRDRRRLPTLRKSLVSNEIFRPLMRFFAACTGTGDVSFREDRTSRLIVQRR